MQSVLLAVAFAVLLAIYVVAGPVAGTAASGFAALAVVIMVWPCLATAVEDAP